MTALTLRHQNDPGVLARLSEPRDDWMVRERRVEADSSDFVLAAGPFHRWNRTVEIQEDSNEIVERFDFALATPMVATPIGWLFRWALRRDFRQAPFWAPPERFDRAGAETLPLLVVATMAAAYLGTLLSQTITYVADDFDADRQTQAIVIAMTRAGALLALVVVWFADRRGRRRMLLGSGAASAIFAALAALSGSIWFYGGAELVSRGFATGFALLIGIFAAEETPSGSRAWTTSILALFAGLGSGMVLWFLPIAGTGTGRWRVLFVIALVALPVIWALRSRLGESRRFDALGVTATARAPITATMRRRFALLAIVVFASSAFAAPSSNFQNEYLRTERGFSAGRISMFSALTSLPVGLGVAVFGPLADRRGRRALGVFGIFAGVAFATLRYNSAGAMMWFASTAGTILGSATIPALGVYGPELFPTSRRGLANGLLTCVGVIGSTGGLYFVGATSDRWGFGPSFALLAVVPIVASLAIAGYPETAKRSLESLNPEDHL